MKALIKKEALEAIGPVAVIFAGLCWFWFACFLFDDVLIAPATGALNCVFAIATLFGAMLGYAQFGIERGRGTQNSAVHRAGGHRRLFFAKMTVGLLATVVLALGPVLIFALWQSQNSPNAPLMQGQRLVEYALASLRGTLGWSIGVLASQLRRAWSGLSFLVLGVLGACLATMSAWVWTDRGFECVAIVAEGITFLIPLVMAFGVGWLALRLFEGARDRELGLPSRQHALVACAGLFLFAFPAYGIAGALASFFGVAVVGGYPIVVRDDASQSLLLMSRDEIQERVRQAQRDRPRPQPSLHTLFDPQDPPREPDVTRFDAHAVRGSRLFGFVASWLPLSIGGPMCRSDGGNVYRVAQYLDEDTGTIQLFWLDGYGHDADHRMAPPRVVSRRDLPPLLPSHLSLTKPGGAQFSPLALGTPCFDRDATCIVDPEDRSLWKLDPFNYANLLSQLSLPDGDRFVRLESLTTARWLRMGRSSWYDGRSLFVGEKGRYILSANGFVPFHLDHRMDEPFHVNDITSDDNLVPLSDVELFTGLRVVESDPDPIHPRVEVWDAKDGKLLFAHTYSPESRWQSFCSGGYIAFTLLRSPVACINAFATKSGHAEPTWLAPNPSGWELLLIGHKRAWLLLSILAVAALCTYSITRRMKRQGAPPWLVGFVALLTVLGGVIAYLYLCALLPRRARSAERPASSTEVRELLIQSA